MRLIPPEDAPITDVERAPMTLSWNEPGETQGYSGHSGEYLLGLPCITGLRGQNGDIPDFVANKLAQDLGDSWSISNRGSRIEIAHNPLGPSDHDLILSAVARLLEQTVLPRFGRN